MQHKCLQCDNVYDASEDACTVCESSLYEEIPITPPEALPVSRTVADKSKETESDDDHHGRDSHAVEEDEIETVQEAEASYTEKEKPSNNSQQQSSSDSATSTDEKHSESPSYDPSKIIANFKELQKQGFKLYGLFGREESGKTSFLYAIKRNIENGTHDFGQWSAQDSEWVRLKKEYESSNGYNPTKRGFHVYKMINLNNKSSVCIIDIAGESFSDVQAWDQEFYDFIGVYLDALDGLWVMYDPIIGQDPLLKLNNDNPKNYDPFDQLESVKNFLSTAAIAKEVTDVNQLKVLSEEMKSRKDYENSKPFLKPITICISKADHFTAQTFPLGEEFGKVVPGSSNNGNPWTFLEKVGRDKFSIITKLAPYLRVSWLSALGSEFENQKVFTRSIGLKHVLDNVIKPPQDVYPNATYLKLKEYAQWIARRLTTFRNAKND